MEWILPGRQEGVGRGMMKKIFRNPSCEEGAALVEFALVFPILLTIILTAMELGIMFAILVNLQGCVQAGAYYGQSGNYTAGSTRAASAQAVMTQGVWGTLNPANLVVTVQSYPDFATASLGGSGTPGSGNAGQVGMYQMQYTYVPSSPLVASLLGSSKVLTATTYVKNERVFPR